MPRDLAHAALAVAAPLTTERTLGLSPAAATTAARAAP